MAVSSHKYEVFNVYIIVPELSHISTCHTSHIPLTVSSHDDANTITMPELSYIPTHHTSHIPLTVSSHNNANTFTNLKQHTHSPLKAHQPIICQTCLPNRPNSFSASNFSISV